jgi:F-type H+-transporting ATPase subunit epsilon
VKLTIVTPLALVVDGTPVLRLTAEDASGRFGILPGHADFLTTLTLSVVTWATAGGLCHAAVKGGVLTVTDGARIEIATPRAVLGNDLATLSGAVLRQFQTEAETERAEHVEQTRLQLSAIRQMVANLGQRAPRP